MKRRLLLAVWLTALALTAACTSAVDGHARPARNLKPRPLGDETVKQVLLDDGAVSRLLQQPLAADPESPPWFGGAEKLRHPFDDASPADCLGVAVLMEKNAYQTAKLTTVAGESWWHTGGLARVISVFEGVATLPSAADADALFATFAEQWKRCEGRTLTLPGDAMTFTDGITDVRVANSVAAATVSIQADFSGRPMPDARAVGVRGNSLVEVEVTFYSTQNPTDQGSGDPRTSAVDIAHRMMDNVSSLS